MAGDFWSQLTQLRSWNPLDYLRQGQQSKYTLMTENEKQQARNLLQTIASGIVPPAAQAEYQQMKADPQQYLQTTVKQPPTQEAQAGMIQNLAGAMPLAFHGSPHKFEKFDISKIGTGQGAQSYGHGLYFAENPKVAETYKEMIVPGMTAHGGAMYKVNIPDEHVAKMLDWDKPLSEQPEVLEAFQRAGLDKETILKNRLTGEGAYQSLQAINTRYGVSNPQKYTSDVLAAEGIPGIKYLDQGSRFISTAEETIAQNKAMLLKETDPVRQRTMQAQIDDMTKRLGKPTRNFVVFDPNILEGPLP